MVDTMDSGPGENAVYDLQIREGRMIHQDQAGLIAHQLHALPGAGEAGFEQRREGRDADDRLEQP